MQFYKSPVLKHSPNGLNRCWKWQTCILKSLSAFTGGRMRLATQAAGVIFSNTHTAVLFNPSQ